MRNALFIMAIAGGLSVVGTVAQAADAVGVWNCETSREGEPGEYRVFTMYVYGDGTVQGQGQMTQFGAATWPYEFQGAWQIQGGEFVMIADAVFYDQFQGAVPSTVEFFAELLDDNRMAYTLNDPASRSRIDSACVQVG